MIKGKYSAGRLGPTALTLLLAAAVTLAARQRRLERERLQDRLLGLKKQAVRREALAHQQRMHWELLVRAIDDPSLAAVIDTYDKTIPAEKRRQFLYANAWYTHLYHVHRSGILNREELYTYLREFFENPLFREYWEASKSQREASESSDEALIGRMVDALDEADRDEWWVTGNPPPE